MYIVHYCNAYFLSKTFNVFSKRIAEVNNSGAMKLKCNSYTTGKDYFIESHTTMCASFAYKSAIFKPVVVLNPQMIQKTSLVSQKKNSYE